MADPSGAAFATGWQSRDREACARQPTCIEGIGRARVEPGFLFEIVDEVIEVPDSASVAAMLLLEERLGVRYGGSSGTNFVACLALATRMRDAGHDGSIVTLLCDRGARYCETLYDAVWQQAHAIDAAPWLQQLRNALDSPP